MTDLQIPEIAEIWKPIVGYEELYEVSNFGKIKSLERTVFDICGKPRKYMEKILIPNRNREGYTQTILTKGKKQKYIKFHYAVAYAFMSPRPAGMIIDHRDGNKENNNVENLEWVSHRENVNRKNKSTHENITYSKSKKTWAVRFYVDGKRIQRTAKTLDDAVKVKEEMMLDYDIYVSGFKNGTMR